MCASACCGLFYLDGPPVIDVALPALVVGTLLTCLAGLPIWTFCALCLGFFAARATEELLVPPLVRGALPPFLVGVVFLVLLRTDFRRVWGKPVGREARWLTPLIVVCSAVGLWLWFKYHPAPRFVQALRRQPAWLLWAALVPVSLANGIGEELIFRGALLSALSRSLQVWLAVVLQAVAFGLWHWNGGLPYGLVGAGMAAALGLALGVLRVFSGSLWPCMLVHGCGGIVMGTFLIRANTCWYCHHLW